MSFLNPIFLFATAAAVLPIVFHLVRKRRAKTIQFSSIRFLKATPKELVRRRRLQDRLLMAARVAVLALLALVFARPYVPADQIPLLPEDRSESVVLLIDRSMSMQYEDTFDRAVRAARARLDAAGSADEFSVVAFSDGPQVLTELGGDFATHRAAIAALTPDFRATRYRTALQRAQDVLQDARHDRKVIVLISDLQLSGWEGTADWKLEDDIELVTEPVTPASARNAAVEAVRIGERHRSGSTILQIDVGVGVHGAAENGPAAVGLLIDGREVDRRDLPQREAAGTTFEYAASREGYLTGIVELDSDGLPADDRFYVAHRVAPLPGVLVAGASPGAPRGDAFYLARAFDLGEDARFRFEASPSLAGAALREFRVVFLAVDGALRDAERDRLRTYLDQGGTVVMSPGSSTSGDALAQFLAEIQLGRVDAVVDSRDEHGYEAIIGQVDGRHPVFQPFATNTSGAIFQPRFRRYLRVEPDTGSRVLARFDTGDPMLVERTVGAGRALLFCSTFNTAWTDLPLDEMFVPFVYSLAEYGSQIQAQHLVFKVGESIRLAGEPGSTLEVRDPEGKIFRVDVDASGAGYFREAEIPGHYAVSSGGSVQIFSVNPDPEESKLFYRDEEEVYAAVVPQREDSDAPARTVASAIVETEEREQKLWRTLLIVVLALFVTETYFANRRTDGAGAPSWNGQDESGKRSGARRPRQREPVG